MSPRLFRTTAITTLFTAMAATAASAVPISITFSGGLDGYGAFDGGTFELVLTGDDAAGPTATYNYSYSNYYDYDYSYFDISYTLKLMKDGNVSTTETRDTTLYAYNFASSSQSYYSDGAGLYDYYYNSDDNTSYDFGVYTQSDSGPNGLFPEDGPLTSLEAIFAALETAPIGGYFYDYGNNYDYYNLDVDDANYGRVNPVPLPAGGMLLLSGLGAFAVARRRKG